MSSGGAKEPAYPVASVGNALRILLMFRAHEVVTVSSCARALEVAPSTAHRLLSMLAHFDFVTRDTKSRGYRAGPALISLSLSARQDLDIRRLARPHLAALASEVNETAQLSVLEFTSVLFVDCVECDQALRVANRVGQRRPAAMTSVGKAMLAEMPPTQLDALYPRGQSLPAMTERSIADREALDEELRLIRQRGYATNFGESDPEIAAIGVAITGPGFTGVGIAVAAPRTRLIEARVPELARAVQRTAARISQSLM
jgi:IclR family transcriptional regulator, acetate operon repressor